MIEWLVGIIYVILIIIAWFVLNKFHELDLGLCLMEKRLMKDIEDVKRSGE